MTRDVFLTWMTAFTDSASPDELATVAKVAERIDAARGYYGALELGRDERDFAREALEESFDGLAYCAMALLRKERADG